MYDVQGDYYRVLKRQTDNLARRTRTVPTRQGRGGVVTPPGFTAGANYILGLQAGNNLRGVGGQNIQFTTGFISTDIAADAMLGAGEAASRSLALFIASMGQAASRKAGLTQIHQEMAERAHTAVNQAYQSRFGDTDRYRVGMNREAGKLGPALARRNWIAATRDGVLFMDRTYLDATAKHWYRLNFGAQPAGKARSAGTFPIKFAGQSAGGLSLKKNRASRRFMIPKGVWLKAGGVVGPDSARSRTEGYRGRFQGDQFYPAKMYFDFVADVVSTGGSAAGTLGKSLKARHSETRGKSGRLAINRASMTKGIRGAHFFDAGVKSLARDMGPAYEGLLEKWSDEAETTGTGPVAKVIATAS